MTKKNYLFFWYFCSELVSYVFLYSKTYHFKCFIKNLKKIFDIFLKIKGLTHCISIPLIVLPINIDKCNELKVNYLILNVILKLSFSDINNLMSLF